MCAMAHSTGYTSWSWHEAVVLSLFVSAERWSPALDHQESRSVHQDTKKKTLPLELNTESASDTLFWNSVPSTKVHRWNFWSFSFIFNIFIFAFVVFLMSRTPRINLPDAGGPGTLLSYFLSLLFIFFFLQIVSVIYFISEEIPRCAISVHIFVKLSCGCWHLGQIFRFIFVTMFSLISIFLKWKWCKDRWGEEKQNHLKTF